MDAVPSVLRHSSPIHRSLSTAGATLGIAVLLLSAGACSDDGAIGSEPATTTPSTTTTSTPATTTTTERPAVSTTEPPSPPVDVGAEAGQPNVAELQAFLSVDPADDGPFYMVNLIRFREKAEYADRRETDLTGEEADGIYGEWMRSTRLPAAGAEIMYVGQVERDLVGGTSFDRVAVVRYPSRTAFAAMAADPEFQAMSVHKDAGVADTIAMATHLIDTPEIPLLPDPPHPATDDDPPFAFVHVFDYRDTAVYQHGDADADNTRSGEDAVATYSANAGTVALPLGVRSLAWFDVQATIIGPSDKWDEVRINWFPSHATFEALTSDERWQSGAHHRSAGLEETYAIQTLPVVNGFG